MQARQPPKLSAGANHFADADKAAIRASIAKVPDNENGPWWDYDKVDHVGCKVPGRHAITQELAQRKSPRVEEDRSKHVIVWDLEAIRPFWYHNLASQVATLMMPKIGRSVLKRSNYVVERPEPEPIGYDEELGNMLYTRTPIRRVLAMCLGTMNRAILGDFDDAVRAHLLAR